MEHLNRELLARLVEEAPTAAERSHLQSCAICREELAALGAQTEALGALPDLRPPRGDWEELEARLISEGLIRGGEGLRRSIFPLGVGWIQAAAALILFLGGTWMGAAFLRDGGQADPAGMEPLVSGEAAISGTPQLVAVPFGRASSVDDAREAVRIAEQNYITALVQYRDMLRAQDEGVILDDPASRYAALDALVRAGQAAVRQIPGDPFLNGFLASAVAEQEAVLRRISTTADDNWY